MTDWPSLLSDRMPIILTLSILGIVFLEWMFLALARTVERNKEGWVSIISAGFAFFPIFTLNKIFLVGLMFVLYEHRLFDLETKWYHWPILWLAYDFGFWLIHVVGHRVRLFWCLHSVHHSAKEMKLSVGFRGSALDFLIVPHNIIWLPLLGFDPIMVIIIDSAAKIYGVLVHIHESWFPRIRWRWMERLLVTPTLHRIHHSTNHAYLDRNYGEAFTIWDQLFGTFQEELSDEVAQYGVMKEVNSENLIDTQTNEFIDLWKDIQSAERPLDKLRYIFLPPGWNHVDGGIMADDLRKAALQEKGLIS